MRHVTLLLCLATAAACGGATQPQSAVAGHPNALVGTFDSPHALARELLAAFERNDRAQLEALAVTEHEFRAMVWPMLPTSRPEVGLPVEYAWRDLHAKSIGHLVTTLHEIGGQTLELVDIDFRGETTDYEQFRVHRRSVLQVRDHAGETTWIRLFGSMIEQDERVKVFSYVVD